MIAGTDRARKLRRELGFLLQLRVLPPRVAAFQWRARRLALRVGDEFSPTSATRPPKLAALLRLARGRSRVVELGTATGWTTISLALADPRREVISYDLVERPERELYLKLVDAGVRERLVFVCAPGKDGASREQAVDLLYIDSSHDRDETIQELEAWRGVLGDGAVVVLDDFTHPKFPGVREAVAQLGLEGEEHAGLFVHRVAASSE